MNEYLRNLDRIEFVVTMACTGKCIHCSEGEHTGCRGSIDANAAAKAVSDICTAFDIRSLMTFGGEPLLYPDVVCAIHRAAAEAGIPQRDIITNGFFSRDSARIGEVAKKLEESGVRRILLSVDAFHQQTIPLEPVMCFARHAAQSSMSIILSPAWLVSAEDDNPYNLRTRELLRGFEAMGIPAGEGNVIFPSGNALKYLSEYFDEDAQCFNPYEDDPRDVRSVCFSPDGSVLDGNLYQKDILDILRDYRP